MPKCRTCGSLQGYGHVAGFLPRDGGSFGCSLGGDSHKPISDELAEVLKMVWDGRFTDGGGCGERPGYTIWLTQEQCVMIEAVLARHEQEKEQADDQQ